MEIIPSNLEHWQAVVVPLPGPNAEWTATVPAGKYWILKSVQMTLAQGASQTPQPVLVLADSSGNIFAESVGATSAQSANTTCVYTWADALVQSGLQGSGTGVHSQAPLPCGSECLLLSGWTVGSNTLGKGANTTYTSIVLYVCQDG